MTKEREEYFMEQIEIKELTPILSEIKNPELRDIVLRFYKQMLDESTFEDYNDVPMIHADHSKKNTYLMHHEAVCTTAAYEVAKCAAEAYQLDMDFDMLIAGDLLHDASKFLEYWKKDGDVGKTPMGKLLTHSLYAAHLAYEKGLPKEIVHIILAHTPVYKVPAATVEAIIAYYTDVLDGEIRRNMVGLPVKAKKTVM